MTRIHIFFYKETGKFYAEETMNVEIPVYETDKLIEAIKEKFNMARHMDFTFTAGNPANGEENTHFVKLTKSSSRESKMYSIGFIEALALNYGRVPEDRLDIYRKLLEETGHKGDFDPQTGNKI